MAVEGVGCLAACFWDLEYGWWVLGARVMGDGNKLPL